MTNEEINAICDRAEAEYEWMKDRLHDLNDENKQLKVKSDLLEENNKLLIQQKTQMYEDLDIAYERIDKAIEYIKSNELDIVMVELLEILGDKENEK